MEIMIEKATAADIDELIQMRLAYLTEDYGALSDDQIKKISTSLPKYFKEHLGKDLIVYAARTSGIVSCSFLLIQEKPANPSFINGWTGTVLNVYTKPAYRRQGLAKKLLEQLISDAGSLNLDYIELKSTSDGYALYRSLGFLDVESNYRNMKLVLS